MNAFFHTIDKCLEANRERILVIYDDTAECFLNDVQLAGKALNKRIVCKKVGTSLHHGEEPDSEVAEEMLLCDAIMCITQRSMAHTNARNVATLKHIPFLSMPGYDVQMISSPAMFTEYAETLPIVRKYTEVLSGGESVRIITDIGTELYLDISGRKGNCCPGLVNDEFLLGSPPDIETNIAPVENNSQGVLVVDGSITDPRLGLINCPVVLHIKDGRIERFESDEEAYVSCLYDIFESVKSDRAYYVGEFGIGFNKDANLCGNMLIDEGTRGCIHFGMGSNWTIGGTNKVGFHLDFVTKSATVYVDDVAIIRKGELLYE